MSANKIKKDTLDNYFKEIAKEYRRICGTKMPAEIILVGGASIMTNYGFRQQSYDIDAIIRASSSMKEAINYVGDKYKLPNNWLNTDFIHTKSYSNKLEQYSIYYKTFSNVLTIRTISGKYLIAMKLMAARQYKNDISDIVGILKEEKTKGNLISLDEIKNAVCDLYDDFNKISKYAKDAIENIFENNNIDELYEFYLSNEIELKADLIEFENKYPLTLKEDNLNDVISALKKNKKNISNKEI